MEINSICVIILVGSVTDLLEELELLNVLILLVNNIYKKIIIMYQVFGQTSDVWKLL